MPYRVACALGGHLDARPRLVPVAGGRDELHGKHLADGGFVPAAGGETVGTADHAEPAPAPTDPFVDPGKVLVAEHIAWDVAQDDRVVGKELRGVFGKHTPAPRKVAPGR